jgi:hypothetical protein
MTGSVAQYASISKQGRRLLQDAESIEVGHDAIDSNVALSRWPVS